MDFLRIKVFTLFFHYPMQNLTADEQQKLQSELSRDEAILWCGKPAPRIHFHRSD